MNHEIAVSDAAVKASGLEPGLLTQQYGVLLDLHGPTLLRYMEQIRNETGVPGMAVAVGLKGEMVFSGGVGWADAAGDGAVAVALRGALVRGDQAILYAGAGITAGSHPAAEAAETDLKLAAVLGLFGAP